MSKTKTKDQQTLTKGPHLEELLRNYFLKAGYYVSRGVPFVYEGFDVTDIDLWLYSRTSSVSREVTLVDALLFFQDGEKRWKLKLRVDVGCFGQNF